MNVGRFRLSRNLILCIAFFTVTIIAASDADAQSENRTWPPKLFKSGITSGLEKPKPISLPKLGLFRNVEPNSKFESRPKMFESFPRLLPERDPNRPNVLRDMNARSKEFFDRTTSGFGDWASRTNNNARNKTNETWGAITHGIKKPDGSFIKKPTNQPPVRSAQLMDRDPKVKF